ncbi:MAG: hypothetical protein JSV64_07115 [Candidatus Bathyarchaeota archaeon]|nr:MAG: hypothetical protein JSV64_07115 [Candidatus Bathyarchaeota archaeon]
MASQIADFTHEIYVREATEIIERIGFFEGLDLITLRERLRKHGVVR